MPKSMPASRGLSRVRLAAGSDTTAQIARWALAAYALLAVLASLHPFSGWRDPGVPFWAFIDDPLPRYLTQFDLVANVLTYLPFGFLAVFAQPAQRHRALVLLLALLPGVLLSFAMEATQTYLPMRHATWTDWLANSAGTLLGALIALPMARAWLNSPAAASWQRQSFVAHPGLLVALVALWLVSQLHPSALPFINGQFVPLVAALLQQWLEIPLRSSPLDVTRALSADQFAAVDTLAAALGLVTLLLLARLSLTRVAPRVVLLLTLLAVAVLCKTVATGLQFGPDEAFGWWGTATQKALLAACVAAVVIAFLPGWVAGSLCVLALLLQMIFVNIVPENPYFAATHTRWQHGVFIGFFGVTQWVAALWPLAALVAVLGRRWREA
ncbi:VanZ family protein [Piscinibacterium candidicorallinum]|jgi:VanZ family protein|uniref:VanZ family protein n=1 Tax=Piscinibacterium candidicorallinum TaxID=1793872 RepID=A0ABV7H6A2_9BURK